MAASTVLDELCAYLVAFTPTLSLKVAPTAGFNLFAGRMFDLPDAAVALIETPGAPPEYDLGKLIQIEHPRVQFLVRGIPDDYAGPRLWAEQIKAALDEIRNSSQSGVRYLNIDILQPPFQLKRDEKERVVICFNVAPWKAPSPTS